MRICDIISARSPRPIYMLSGSWYIYTNGSAESTFDMLFGKNHIGIILPDRSL